MAEPRAFEEVLVDVLRALERRQARYVLVGGAAVILHGLSRLTEDIDLFLPLDGPNLERVKDALRDVFADPSIDEISAEDLGGAYAVVRYGPPDTDLVVDIMTRVGEAFVFDDLQAQEVGIADVRALVATPETLFRMKRGTLRAKDRNDAEALRRRFEKAGAPWA